MTELVETIAKALVEDPDQVEVTEAEGRDGDTVYLQVAGDDMGRVIGKKGRIAKALRTVVKAAAAREKRVVTVEIVSAEDSETDAAAATGAAETEE